MARCVGCNTFWLTSSRTSPEGFFFAAWRRFEPYGFTAIKSGLQVCGMLLHRLPLLVLLLFVKLTC